jgi:hypothetical protein
MGVCVSNCRQHSSAFECYGVGPSAQVVFTTALCNLCTRALRVVL